MKGRRARVRRRLRNSIKTVKTWVRRSAPLWGRGIQRAAGAAWHAVRTVGAGLGSGYAAVGRSAYRLFAPYVGRIRAPRLGGPARLHPGPPSRGRGRGPSGVDIAEGRRPRYRRIIY